jgi:hypothetical protein
MTTKREFLTKDSDTVIKTDVCDDEVALWIYNGADEIYMSSNTYGLPPGATPEMVMKAADRELAKWRKMEAVIQRCIAGTEDMFSLEYDKAVARKETRDAD